MTDDELRHRLRAIDPAASLPAADPQRVARLLEDTMTDQQTVESRADGTHDRSRLTWLVAAAAAVLIGGGVLFAVTQGDDDPAPPAAGDSPSQDVAPTAETVTRLTLDGNAPASRCVAPEAAPEIVAAQTVVFDGTVTAISGGIVTLEPSRFYAGDETDLVTVRAVDRDMQALLAGVRFEEGGRYLVSATGGQVTLCGFSGEYTDALAGVYETAFPG